MLLICAPPSLKVPPGSGARRAPIASPRGDSSGSRHNLTLPFAGHAIRVSLRTLACWAPETSGKFGTRGGLKARVRHRLQVRRVSDLPPNGRGKPRSGSDL